MWQGPTNGAGSRTFPAWKAQRGCAARRSCDRSGLDRGGGALRVRRRAGEAAYASTDGSGTILIGARHTLDSNDSLAQLVLHELCHALVQGEASWTRADWGLDNTGDWDAVREEACLRLQARLADRQGLRAAMAPTTEWRSYYHALAAVPLNSKDVGEDVGDERAPPRRAPWPRPRSRSPRQGTGAGDDEALTVTAALLRPKGAGQSGGLLPSRPAGQHPIGFKLGPSSETCGTCAWRYHGGRGPAVDRCRQSVGEVGDGQRVEAAFPACERFEAPVDCLTCGACCREAYHSVNVSMRDPVVWKQPGLMVRNGHRWSLLRAGERCAALDVTGPTRASATRADLRGSPDTCRDFEPGERHCLVARRRVGLSH